MCSSITDFLGAASKIAQRDGRLVEMYLFAAVVYFAISFALSQIVRQLQARTAIVRWRNAMDRMIDIQSISKWYGPVQALKSCTTHVAKGDVVVVCGPSGCGKSTLIKCVNALEPIQKGDMCSTASASLLPRRIYRNYARASAWYSSISSCSRT